jgi:hypothetical protein
MLLKGMNRFKEESQLKQSEIDSLKIQIIELKDKFELTL